MAKRISGRILVRITWLDEDGCYKARVSNLDKEGPPIKVYVNPPKCSKMSVVSPEAYDDAAHDAIVRAGVLEYAAFACHEMVLERIKEIQCISQS